MKRFELKKDAGDTWTLTDTVSGISLRFKEHEFNETAGVYPGIVPGRPGEGIEDNAGDGGIYVHLSLLNCISRT